MTTEYTRSLDLRKLPRKMYVTAEIDRLSDVGFSFRTYLNQTAYLNFLSVLSHSVIEDIEVPEAVSTGFLYRKIASGIEITQNTRSFGNERKGFYFRMAKDVYARVSGIINFDSSFQGSVFNFSVTFNNFLPGYDTGISYANFTYDRGYGLYIDYPTAVSFRPIVYFTSFLTPSFVQGGTSSLVIDQFTHDAIEWSGNNVTVDGLDLSYMRSYKASTSPYPPGNFTITADLHYELDFNATPTSITEGYAMQTQQELVFANSDAILDYWSPLIKSTGFSFSVDQEKTVW